MALVTPWGRRSKWPHGMNTILSFLRFAVGSLVDSEPEITVRRLVGQAPSEPAAVAPALVATEEEAVALAAVVEAVEVSIVFCCGFWSMSLFNYSSLVSLYNCYIALPTNFSIYQMWPACLNLRQVALVATTTTTTATAETTATLAAWTGGATRQHRSRLPCQPRPHGNHM